MEAASIMEVFDWKEQSDNILVIEARLLVSSRPNWPFRSVIK